MKNIKQDVKNIEQFLADAQRPATLHSSDTFVQQMPLKPGIFHERDDIIDEITQLLMKEETSCICIFGPGGIMPLGWVRLQFHWASSNSHSSKPDFYPKTLSGCLALTRRRQLSF